jgi:hypothetical protein
MQPRWHAVPNPWRITARVTHVGDGKRMPQHAHAKMTTEQLDLLTVGGHLDLDRLEQLQQRLDDMPGSGRVVYAMHGVEPNPVPRSVLGLWWEVPAPDPGGQRTNRRAGVGRTRSPRRERGPSCAPAWGT